MAVTADNPVPYAPTGQMVEILNRYRNRGNPQAFDLESLARIGVPDSLATRTLQALKTLDLVDENGAPTQTFESLRLAPEAEYNAALEAWLKVAYSDVFDIVDPATDDETRVRDAFRSYNPAGQQGRMVSLFIGLCELAGIREKAEKKRETGGSNRSPRTTRKPAPRKKAAKQQKGNSGTNAMVAGVPGLPASLSGLLQSLPAEGKGWTQEQRNKFHETFGTLLDFCYPIVTENDFIDSEDLADED